ncbi:MAG: PEGA domain-containing protein [Vicinamibacterales bacterium]
MLHQVGVGALGPVFRTYEPTRDRLVAVKVFRLDVTPEQAQSLADELSVAADAGLFHPSVVEPIAAGVEGTVAYRAEEYVAAETLDVALRHYAPAPIDKVLPIITQLAGAIDFARTAGVGHGALHPRDIFVTPEETRATGFGVVEALERVGLRAPVRRPYSAPERVAGQKWGTPADVFSLAAIAYELLTGRRPAGTGAQIGAVTGTTAGPHPAALHAVFVQAMDDDPARRFQTALAFASALDAAASGDQPIPVAAAGTAAGVAGVAGLASAEAVPEDVDAAAEEPEFDDVLAEKDEDEAHAELLRQEAEMEDADDAALEPASGGLLFNDEALADLTLDAPAIADTERFADEFTLAATGLPEDDAPEAADEVDAVEDEADVEDALEEEEIEAGGAEYDEPAPLAAVPYEPARAPRGFLSDDEPPPVFHDRPRSSFLSHAVIGVLGLLVGFAAGHAVASRMQDAPPGTGVSDGSVAGAPGPDSAQPYSEETLAPPQQPAAAPPAAGEAPPPTEPPAAVADRETSPVRGRVVVRSTPPGANVTLDGDWRGRTPLTLDTLPFGAYEIRVVLSGYEVARETVRLTADSPSRTLTVPLRRSAPARTPRAAAAPPRDQAAKPQTFTGSIYVDSRPRGARVLLDGKPVGTTPLRLPDVSIGSHIVKLQLADHTDWTTSTRVVSGQEARVTGSLERIR